LSKIHYKTRTEAVLDLIKEDILSGVLKSGEPLRQSSLAEKYQVSRIPIREALLQLESQGLVQMEAHKGAIVTQISIEEIDELFQLRALLEPYILERAIPNMDEDCFKQCDAILTKLETALDTKQNIDLWSEYNYEFHQTLYQPANLFHTLDIIKILNTRSDRYIRLQLLYTNGIEKAEKEHRQLLEYCQKGKTKQAIKLLHDHIHVANLDIKKFFKNKPQ
jgi:DNA-binding GntR family transcriptional regulator